MVRGRALAHQGRVAPASRRASLGYRCRAVLRQGVRSGARPRCAVLGAEGGHQPGTVEDESGPSRRCAPNPGFCVRQIHRRFRDRGSQARESDDDGVFDLIGLTRGTTGCLRGGVRYMSSDAGAASASAASPVLQNVGFEVLLPDQECAGPSTRSFHAARFYPDCTASPPAARPDPQELRSRLMSLRVRALPGAPVAEPSTRGERARRRRRQFGQQFAGRFQDGRIEPLGESSIDGREHVLRFTAAAPPLQ